MAWKGQTIAACAPELASHLPLALQDRLFTLAGVTRHAHVLAVGELPAVQRILLHGGDDEIAVRREGDRRMRAGPFELGRLAVGGREMQRHAIVAGYAETHALGREGEAFHRARMLEFFRLAVGEAHEGRLAGGIGDRALRT